MYKLVKCTNELLENTKIQWLSKAKTLGDLGVFIATDIENKFLGFEKQDTATSDLHMYCLIDDPEQNENPEADAKSILQIIHALPNSDNGWLKLLDITLDPVLTFDSGSVTEEEAKKSFMVLANSIIWSMTLIFKDFKDAGSIKIYGRTDIMRDMFVSLLSTGMLHEHLSPIGVNVRKESTWLVFEKQK